ncbi:MAG TPA: hypothetical protein VM142_01705 [Acidimicrobiales bacterium]|nr:hypothetical protein [Acidimicrobiales bacterium]
MTDYADEYDDLDEEQRAEELADLQARIAALSGGTVAADATSPPPPPPQVTQPEPEPFDHLAHAANVESLVNANFETAEDFYAAAAARGLLHEEQPPPPPPPTDAARAACLEEGLSEEEFWRRANAAGVVAGNAYGVTYHPGA